MACTSRRVARERVSSPSPARIEPMERRQAKKEKVSYGKALSSQCLRAHQQRNDLIFVAPGHKGMEFLTAHGSRTEKWQADRDPNRDFCPGSETLPHCHLR